MIKKWIEKRRRDKWFKEMDFKPTTERQKELLNQMLFKAMIEIRALCWGGHAEQAAALIDAFHNLPTVMYSEEFSFPWFRSGLETYQNRYRPSDYQKGFDYTDMLDRVLREEDLWPQVKQPR